METIEQKKKRSLRMKKYYTANREKILAKTHTEEARAARRIIQDRWRKNNPMRNLLVQAKHRAKVANIPFDLEPEDLECPTHCPVLGIKLIYGSTRHDNNSASMDRLIPKKGYVKGNVIIISYRANRIKCDASLKELKKVYEFYKDIL